LPDVEILGLLQRPIMNNDESGIIDDCMAGPGAGAH